MRKTIGRDSRRSESYLIMRPAVCWCDTTITTCRERERERALTSSNITQERQSERDRVGYIVVFGNWHELVVIHSVL